MENNEIVYILINEAMPDYVKIGRTTNLEQRIRSLDVTSVPLPFECFYACTVRDANFVERSLHDAFGGRYPIFRTPSLTSLRLSVCKIIRQCMPCFCFL